MSRGVIFIRGTSLRTALASYSLFTLSILEQAWTHIAMDIFEGLPNYEFRDVILGAVDRFNIYAHFILLDHPITAKEVAAIRRKC